MQTIHSAEADLHIYNGYYGSDHFSLMTVVNLEFLQNTLNGSQSESKIKMNFSNSNKVEELHSNAHRYMVHELDYESMCHTPYCESFGHKQKLEVAWS